MALLSILHDAGAAIIRTPLLWFFSAIALIANLPSTASSSTQWGCLSLLMLPISVLAMAGQIRSVQLRYEHIPSSISQIIRYSLSRIGPLLAAMGLYTLFYFFLAFGIWSVMKFIFPQMSLIVTTYIIGFIITPFMSFAFCAIVISNLSLGSSIFIGFRAIKKDALSVFTLSILFGLLGYSLIVSHSKMVLNPFRIAVYAAYYVVDLIVYALEAAIITFAYHYCIENIRAGITTDKFSTQNNMHK
jgi:hypothetical protein